MRSSVLACFAALSFVAACGRSDLDEGAFGAGGATGASATASTSVSSSSSSATGTSSNATASSSSGTGGAAPVCGNGVVEIGEACDDGNTSNNDGCLNDCKQAKCGDGFVWTGVEQCDDGNKDNHDGCRNDCVLGTCGNGVIDPGEECDDGNDSNDDACLNNCTNATCGDGFVWSGFEQCDDGNTSNNDGCLNDCTNATCGDGFVWTGVEQCDDGNASNNDSCLNDCKNATCGDGFLWIGVEQCDDGNSNNADGCHTDCKLGVCGDGIVDPGEACDDGNTSNNDACVAGCKSATCGDGYLWIGVEQCDDGNLIPDDGCSPTCKLPVCGDGHLDPGEACDLGAANQDRPAFLLRQDPLAQAVVPYDHAQDAALFYDYFSASSHTGFEVLGASRLYLYRDTTTGILSLFTHHGIDADTSGQFQPSSDGTMSILNLPASTIVALSDDTPSEFAKDSATSAKGNWHFQNNTDGGVVSGLPFPGTWSIDITLSFSSGITSWAYRDANGTAYPLVLGTVAHLTAFDSPSACRTNCTVPRCGDGILDGGEICDDGNNVSGDGCSADCKSLQ